MDCGHCRMRFPLLSSGSMHTCSSPQLKRAWREVLLAAVVFVTAVHLCVRSYRIRSFQIVEIGVKAAFLRLCAIGDSKNGATRTSHQPLFQKAEFR